MKRIDKKSDCAINYALEAVGDSWSLLIIRDMVTHGKKTYSEFLAADERIGTSVLARKLAMLEQNGIILKRRSLADGRREEYSLTQKGIDLIPVLGELAAWGATYDQYTGANKQAIRAYQQDRQGVIDRTQQAVISGSSVVDSFDAIYKNIKSKRVLRSSKS